VNAHGRIEHDLFYLPDDRKETDRINDELLATGQQFAYGDSGIEAQKLWIFPPLAAQPGELRPCVFFIHGGGWGGHPRSLAAQSVYLQRRGYTTVSIHFRPPKGNNTPKDTLRDARKAYRWIIEHGREHHIDPNRIVVSGGSAGGHLSLALSTISLNDDSVIEVLPKGYVLFNPVIDLVDGWAGGRKKCEAAGIAPLSFSPAHHVRAGLPPTLILSGSNDGLIPPRLIHTFQTRMKQVGSDCRFVEYPGASHGFFNYGREDNRYFRLTMQAFEDFLVQLHL
jgi:acetyl esterase/lipase